jgi:hypothetical protein
VLRPGGLEFASPISGSGTLSGVKAEAIVRVVLAVFLACGYFYAYRRVKTAPVTKSPKGPLGRINSFVFSVLMVLCAVGALGSRWDGSILSLLILGCVGCPMNIYWFYVGMTGVSARKQTPSPTQ